MFLITFQRFGKRVASKLVNATSMDEAFAIGKAIARSPRFAHNGLGVTGFVVAPAKNKGRGA